MDDAAIDAGGGSAGLLQRLRQAGLMPRRSQGQHFLHDPSILAGIVAAAELPADAQVFEVGTGPATLTRHLAAAAARVVTVEVDARFAAFARRELRGVDHVEILLHDVLGAAASGIHPEVLARLRELSESGGFHFVANLPYGVATTLLIEFLAQRLRWRRAVLMVQAEVADRLCATPADPGAKSASRRGAYGPATLLVGYWAEVRIVRRIPPGAFWPPPRVDSAVVRLEPRKTLPQADFGAYRDWVRGLFQGRRKQLGRLLRELLGAEGAARALELGGWDERLRPENLDSDDIARLARIGLPGR